MMKQLINSVTQISMLMIAILLVGCSDEDDEDDNTPELCAQQ